jgi:hypothetical protein
MRSYVVVLRGHILAVLSLEPTLIFIYIHLNKLFEKVEDGSYWLFLRGRHLYEANEYERSRVTCIHTDSDSNMSSPDDTLLLVAKQESLALEEERELRTALEESQRMAQPSQRSSEECKEEQLVSKLSKELEEANVKIALLQSTAAAHTTSAHIRDIKTFIADLDTDIEFDNEMIQRLQIQIKLRAARKAFLERELQEHEERHEIDDIRQCRRRREIELAAEKAAVAQLEEQLELLRLQRLELEEKQNALS